MADWQLRIGRKEFTTKREAHPGMQRWASRFRRCTGDWEVERLGRLYFGGLILCCLIFAKRSLRLIWRDAAAFVRFHPVLVSA
jgi:hypothetical protein